MKFNYYLNFRYIHIMLNKRFSLSINIMNKKYPVYINTYNPGGKYI